MSTRHKYGTVKLAVLLAESEGLTVREAAERFAISPRSIRSAASHAQVTLRRERRPLGSVKAMVLAALEAGMTVPQMVESSGVADHTIYATLRRLKMTAPLARRRAFKP